MVNTNIISPLRFDFFKANNHNYNINLSSREQMHYDLWIICVDGLKDDEWMTISTYVYTYIKFVCCINNIICAWWWLVRREFREFLVLFVQFLTISLNLRRDGFVEVGWPVGWSVVA